MLAINQPLGTVKRITVAVLMAFFKGLFREKLSAARTYYVRTNGSDANSGLTNTAAGAFATVQKAIDTVVALDLSVFQVTIQIADGTYTAPITLRNFVGDGPIVIQGNLTTPNSVVLNATSGNTVLVSALSSKYTLRKFKVTNTGTSSSIYVEKNSQLTLVGVNFGVCANAQLLSADGSTVFLNDSYEISGNGYVHFYASYSGQLIVSGGVTITLTGTPAFSYAFAAAPSAGFMRIVGVTISGAGTGKRFVSDLNSVIQVGGTGQSFLPGDVAGTTSTGGQYA